MASASITHVPPVTLPQQILSKPYLPEPNGVISQYTLQSICDLRSHIQDSRKNVLECPAFAFAAIPSSLAAG
jgi:hypothetical protein